MSANLQYFMETGHKATYSDTLKVKRKKKDGDHSPVTAFISMNDHMHEYEQLQYITFKEVSFFLDQIVKYN